MAEGLSECLNSKEGNGRFLGKLPHLPDNSSREAIKTFYDEWSQCYEKEIDETGYVGATILAKKVFEVCQEQNHSKTVRIIDLGAGTGSVAKLLRKYDISNIDALDLSPEMLKLAEEQDLYKNYFCEGLGNGRLPIDDNSYDMATAAGCFGRGHVVSSGLDEAVRIVKSGGFIIWTIRVDMYNDEASDFAAKVQDFTERKIWVVHEKRQVDYHLNAPELDGLLYCFLFVCKKI